MLYTQDQARDVISDLDSFDPKIQARGRKKLAILEQKGSIDLGEMHRIAKSAWTPETTQNVSSIAIACYIAAAAITGVVLLLRWIFS